MDPILVRFYWHIKEYFTWCQGYIGPMARINVKKTLGKNLQDAIVKKYGAEAAKSSQSQLARDTNKKVSQKTISNILSANLRDGPDLESVPAASIEVVAQLAYALGMHPWELIHPDPEKARREHSMYLKIEQDFKLLPAIGQKRRATDKEGNRD